MAKHITNTKYVSEITEEDAQDMIYDLSVKNKILQDENESLKSALQNTNCIDKKRLSEYVHKFRQWQRSWDLFDKQVIEKKPISVDEFIDNLLQEKLKQ